MINREALVEQFNALDKDDSGEVEAFELIAIMPEADKVAISNILAAMDRNLDQKISLDEYLSWFLPSDGDPKNDTTGNT